MTHPSGDPSRSNLYNLILTLTERPEGDEEWRRAYSLALRRLLEITTPYKAHDRESMPVAQQLARRLLAVLRFTPQFYLPEFPGVEDGALLSSRTVDWLLDDEDGPIADPLLFAAAALDNPAWIEELSNRQGITIALQKLDEMVPPRIGPSTWWPTSASVPSWLQTDQEAKAELEPQLTVELEPGAIGTVDVDFASNIFNDVFNLLGPPPSASGRRTETRTPLLPRYGR